MRIEEMRIETKEHYRVTVLEDRIEEFEEDTKVLKEQIDILGSVLYDIVHNNVCKKASEDALKHISECRCNKKEDKKSKKDDAKEFSKKLEIIVKILGRKLKLEEALLLAIFESLEIDGDEKKEEKKMNNESITGYKELDDALNSIPSDELDRMLKAESERKKGTSNHEFSDALAQAALDMFGIDLKKGEDNG